MAEKLEQKERRLMESKTSEGGVRNWKGYSRRLKEAGGDRKTGKSGQPT